MFVNILNLLCESFRPLEYFCKVQEFLLPGQLFTRFRLFDKGIEFLFGQWHTAKVQGWLYTVGHKRRKLEKVKKACIKFGE